MGPIFILFLFSSSSFVNNYRGYLFGLEREATLDNISQHCFWEIMKFNSRCFGSQDASVAVAHGQPSSSFLIRVFVEVFYTDLTYKSFHASLCT
jgi:hypothetical protein